MIVTCPSCEAKYRVEPSALEARRGKVKCAACNHVWTVAEAAPKPAPAAPEPAPAPAPAPEPPMSCDAASCPPPVPPARLLPGPATPIARPAGPGDYMLRGAARTGHGPACRTMRVGDTADNGAVQRRKSPGSTARARADDAMRRIRVAPCGGSERGCAPDPEPSS